MAITARVGADQSQELRTASRYFMWMDGTQAFEPSSATFPGALKGVRLEVEHPRLELVFRNVPCHGQRLNLAASQKLL